MFTTVVPAHCPDGWDLAAIDALIIQVGTELTGLPEPVVTTRLRAGSGDPCRVRRLARQDPAGVGAAATPLATALAGVALGEEAA